MGDAIYDIREFRFIVKEDLLRLLQSVKFDHHNGDFNIPSSANLSEIAGRECGRC